MPGKEVPQRTCVSCRQVKPKRELVRLVKTPEGVIEIDASGKKKGRGAYLCHDQKCWEAGLKRKVLEHAFRGPITADNQEGLRKIARENLQRS